MFTESNREELAGELGFDEIIMPKLKHGCDVYVVDDGYEFENRPTADIIMTDHKGKLVGVPTADCVAILIYDPVNKAVAAVHSGWRGTQAQASESALSEMTRIYRTRPVDLSVYISPAPQRMEFEVGREVAELFDPKYITTDQGRYWFDNKAAVFDQLVGAGVKPENIEVSEASSYSEMYHSYRRDGEASGRHVAVIGLKS